MIHCIPIPTFLEVEHKREFCVGVIICFLYLDSVLEAFARHMGHCREACGDLLQIISVLWFAMKSERIAYQ